MKAKRSEKRGLGKGLGALIPVAEREDEETVREINIEDIRPNSFQPRRAFDEEKLAEMAESVRTHGIYSRWWSAPSWGYEVVAGERRWRALNWPDWCVYQLLSGNCPRRNDGSGVDRKHSAGRFKSVGGGRSLKILLTEFGLTQEELAQRVGKSRSHRANK